MLAEALAPLQAELAQREADLTQRETAQTRREEQFHQTVRERVEQGVQAHVAEWGAAFQAITTAGQQLQTAADDERHAAEGQIIELAAALAARVLRREADLDEAWMVAQLEGVPTQVMPWMA